MFRYLKLIKCKRIKSENCTSITSIHISEQLGKKIKNVPNESKILWPPPCTECHIFGTILTSRWNLEIIKIIMVSCHQNMVEISISDTFSHHVHFNNVLENKIGLTKLNQSCK